MTRVHAGDRDGQSVLYLTCAGCDWQGDVWYTTCPPRYCSDACKQKAYRERKRAELVTQLGGDDVTDSPKPKIERAIDMTLHLLKCPTCERSIWTVLGNVKIGRLLCGLCGEKFKAV